MLNLDSNYIVITIWNGEGYSSPIINSFTSETNARQAFEEQKEEMIDGGYIEDNENIEQPKHSMDFQYFKSAEDNGLVVLLHYPAVHAAILKIDPMILDIDLKTVIKPNARSIFINSVISEPWEDKNVLDEFDPDENNSFGEHIEDGYSHFELILDRFVDSETHKVEGMPQVGMTVSIVSGQGGFTLDVFTGKDEIAWEQAIKNLVGKEKFTDEQVKELNERGYLYIEKTDMEYRIVHPDSVTNLEPLF